MNTKLFEAPISNDWVFKWSIAYILCTRLTIQILDQYIWNQDGIHLSGIQMAFQNQTIWHQNSFRPFEYWISSVFRSPLYDLHYKSSSKTVNHISIIIFFTEKHLKNKDIHYWRKSWREENWNLWTFSPWHIQQTEMRISTVTIRLPDTWIPDSTEICSSLCPVFKWLCQNSTDHLITWQKHPAFEWLKMTSLFKNQKIFSH